MPEAPILLFSISDGALERLLRYILNAEGKQEGLSEGQLRAFRTAVLRAVEIRQGSCPEGIREAVEAVNDPARLETLLESAIRSESLEAFAQNL